MPRVFAIVAALVVLGACGSSAARSEPDAVGAHVSQCGPASARTLAANSVARVYVVRQTVYGCSNRTGVRTRLGVRSSSCVDNHLIGLVIVLGDLAAYGDETCGVDTGTTSVIVRRLSDGRQLSSDRAMTGVLPAESYQSVDSVAMKSDGAVAWIATASSIVGHARATVEVHAADKRGRRLLDSGASINAQSLALRGSTITWKHGGVTRSATLD